MTPTFQFFEDICSELESFDEVVLPDDTFLSKDILLDLQEEYRNIDLKEVIPQTLLSLQTHFEARNARLPFNYDLSTRTYTAVDKPFIEFISNAVRMRGIRAQSRNFEIATTKQLSFRGIGDFHRVGWPREKFGKLSEFNTYLSKLGFNKVVFGREKDGGLDIVWLLPLGAIPYRPVISFQCKNGSYDFSGALESNGTTDISLNCHRGLVGSRVHTICVVFNDYIQEKILPQKPINFVPLGLSDLASKNDPFTSVVTL